MISIVCYLWRGPRAFLPSYVNVLARMVAKHLPEPHRFICVTDEASGFSKDVEIISMPPAARVLATLDTPEGARFPSSYRRLWTFSREARQLGERVLLLDIDCLIVSDLRRLFIPSEDFVGWRVRSPPGGPRRFAGGTWLHRTGTRTHVWERFVADPQTAIRQARTAGYRGSDQAWISYCLSESETSWPEPSGIFCAQDYRKKNRVAGGARSRSRFRQPVSSAPSPPLAAPAGAIILHMNGAADAKPWTSNDALVLEHWRPHLIEDQPGSQCSA